MRRAIRPDWLIRQAEEMAVIGAGQPRNADLRRAVSSAYYGLFHAITGAAANELISKSSDDDKLKFTRHIDHRSIKMVCEWVLGLNQPTTQKGNIYRDIIVAAKTSTLLTDLAIIFTSLQDERHRADYDHFANFTRPQVLSLINDAKRGCEIVKRIHGTSEAQSFYMMLAVVSKVPNT
jgi:uncharacterized protein (UPF0332 family)